MSDTTGKASLLKGFNSPDATPNDRLVFRQVLGEKKNA